MYCTRYIRPPAISTKLLTHVNVAIPILTSSVARLIFVLMSTRVRGLGPRCLFGYFQERHPYGVIRHLLGVVKPLEHVDGVTHDPGLRIVENEGVRSETIILVGRILDSAIFVDHNKLVIDQRIMVEVVGDDAICRRFDQSINPLHVLVEFGFGDEGMES